MQFFSMTSAHVQHDDDLLVMLHICGETVALLHYYYTTHYIYIRVMRMDVVIKGASVNEQGIGSGAKEDQRAGPCRLY